MRLSHTLFLCLRRLPRCQHMWHEGRKSAEAESELLSARSHPGPYCAPNYLFQGGLLSPIHISAYPHFTFLRKWCRSLFRGFCKVGFPLRRQPAFLAVVTAHLIPKELGFFVTTYVATRSHDRDEYFRKQLVENTELFSAEPPTNVVWQMHLFSY